MFVRLKGFARLFVCVLVCACLRGACLRVLVGAFFFMCSFACAFLCLFACLCVCLFVSVCLCVGLFVWLAACLCVVFCLLVS